MPFGGEFSVWVEAAKNAENIKNIKGFIGCLIFIFKDRIIEKNGEILN
tara:strand:+ start:1223 stop:1366 length:144 start_codon:yes stop_codon:yes gene_type:complete